MKITLELFTILFIIFENFLKISFEFLGLVIDVFIEKPGYHATFISEGKLLSSWNKGFCLTGKRNVTVKNSYENALVIGGSGRGKTSCVLIPSIFSMDASMVIHDPSGELFNKSSGYLALKGYAIKILNFSNPAISDGYNPIVRAQSSSDISKVASMVVRTTLGHSKGDPFWTLQSNALIELFLKFLKTKDSGYQTFTNTLHLLNTFASSPKKLDLLFARCEDEKLFAEYKAFIAYENKVLSNIIATCKAALNIFNDDSISRVTSHDTIDFQEFRNRKTALFIQNSVADQAYYSVLTSIFFEQLFSFIMSRFPKEGENDIFLLIDECSSLQLPTLPLAVANVRKHSSGILLLVQDFNQLVHNYGQYDAEAIRANCFAKLFFTGQSLDTSRDLELLLGKYEIEEENGNRRVLPLLTNDQIRTMDASNALLICSHYPPIKANLKPYYKQRSLRKLSSLTPYEVIDKLPFTEPPLLQFDN